MATRQSRGTGPTYTPPSQPIYDLDDDDFMASNQTTNPKSVSAASSPDPVIITRTDIADQENDIKLEYLDRANQYNPTIVEAKDDAAIAFFGVKSSGSKQLHLFCDRSAALASAQLMLGRQQILRSFAFTLGREYILLDPMDIVAITDTNAGLPMPVGPHQGDHRERRPHALRHGGGISRRDRRGPPLPASAARWLRAEL